MNVNGNPENLLPGTARPLQPNFRHGAFAKIRLPLTEEEVEEVEGLLELRHTVPPDRAAAEEVVRLRSMIARLDSVIMARLERTRGQDPTTLLSIRSSLSGRLLTYLEAFGLTPKSRADWARKLEAGSFEDRVRRRMEELEGGPS